MNKEEIIRDEATTFFRFSNGKSPIDQFHEIKNRLTDFYSDNNKSIFLDEIKNIIKLELISHREKAHNGEAVATCRYEITAEKLIFYIEQELSILPSIINKNKKTSSVFNRSKVFVSYSHRDKDFLVELRRHFKPFLDKIDFWDDGNILPGQKWKDEIEKAMNETKVAILLVTTDFLGSDFISNNEVPTLLKAAENDGATILIVILRPCLFDAFPKLNQFQALNRPEFPVSKMTDNEREDFLVNLVKQTMKALNA